MIDPDSSNHDGLGEEKLQVRTSLIPPLILHNLGGIKLPTESESGSCLAAGNNE
jgi:hypothetical protein